jgi:Transposase IS4
MEPNAPPEVAELTVPQPQAAERYYSACAMIDRHNRYRRDDLQLEHMVKTMTWWKRVNLSILGMCVVDAYFVF